MIIRKILYILIFSFLLLGVLGYGFYKALPLILGPKIEIASPTNGDAVEGTTVNIRGTVVRSQQFYVNGIATAFTKEGLFETRIPIYPGNNILTLTALDRFNRQTTVNLTLGTK
jgi:hypothetical protein